MAFLLKTIQLRIDKKLKVLQDPRPLPPAVVAKLKEQFSIEMTYNSNAIEGNHLTLKETSLVLNEGMTVKGKPLKDHLEAKNHFEALQYLYDLIEHDKKHTFSEHLIRSLQQLIVRETDGQTAGKYRAGSVLITGSKHTPPDATDVPTLMHELMAWLSKARKNTHPVEVAALVHHKISHIHPFFDGNGRTARLVMNLLLMQHGFPLVSILKNDRKKYYSVLEKADGEDFVPLVRFIAQAVERSLNIYLKVLERTKTAKKYLPLSAVAKKTPYSEKYLNLLVRQGKLEAHKEGRIWVTTLEAIEEYRSGRLRKR